MLPYASQLDVSKSHTHPLFTLECRGREHAKIGVCVSYTVQRVLGFLPSSDILSLLIAGTTDLSRSTITAYGVAHSVFQCLNIVLHPVLGVQVLRFLQRTPVV